MGKIIVTGAFGLVGSDLVPELQKMHGKENVIATDVKVPADFKGISQVLDVRDKDKLEGLIKENDPDEIYHLAGLLSAGGEKNPDLAWAVNLGGLKNVLDISVKHEAKVFWPSSIAAFGPSTPRNNTPQHTVLEPTTIYGVTKVAGELLCQYYFQRHGLDVRSLRYPGLLGYKADPGDGTTEYAAWVFYGAIRDGKYTCYLKEDATLPMMYMDDAVGGTLKLMEAEKERIHVRTSYNFAAINFAPREIYAEIKRLQPGFRMDYAPDFRQKIADSWPTVIDDSDARKDWGWKPQFDLRALTKVMYEGIQKKLKG